MRRERHTRTVITTDHPACKKYLGVIKPFIRHIATEISSSLSNMNYVLEDPLSEGRDFAADQTVVRKLDRSKEQACSHCHKAKAYLDETLFEIFGESVCNDCCRSSKTNGT